MKKNNPIGKIIILALILVFLLNPRLNPLLSEATKDAVSQELAKTFGGAAGSVAGNGITVPKLAALFTLIIGVWLLTLIIHWLVGIISSRNPRAATIGTMISSLVRYISVIVVVIWGLSILGVNLTAIVASVGVLSLIIGFGAQSLIEDTITGIFMILENNLKVDDYIVLDDFRGRVRKIGIRTTCIEDDGGNLKIVNNSDIRNFQNRSEHLSLAVCDIDTSYDDDIRTIEDKLLPALETMYQENSDVFEAVPVYKGIESFGDSGVVIRVTVAAKEENVFMARRRLNRALKIFFDENQIEIPYTQIVVHQEK